jgi:hypothetical protein
MKYLRAAILFSLFVSSASIASGGEDRLLTADNYSRPVAEDPYNRVHTVADGLATLNPKHVAPPAQTIHAVVLVDEAATGIEKAVAEDRDSIKDLLTRSFRAPAFQLDLTVLNVATMTPKQVVNHVAALHVGRDDTLFVYYSGHGETETTDERIGTIPTVSGDLPMFRTHHIFQFGGRQLARANVRAAMDRTGARLKILITDCCRPPAENLHGGRAPLDALFKIRDRYDTSRINEPVVNGLFTSYEGFIDVSTADALSDPKLGGIMTRSFVAACCYNNPTYQMQPRMVRGRRREFRPNRVDINGDGIVTWRELFQLWSHFIREAAGNEQFAVMDTY